MAAPRPALSLAARLGRLCERLNGFRMATPPAPDGASAAAFIIRDAQGVPYRVEVRRYV